MLNNYTKLLNFAFCRIPPPHFAFDRNARAAAKQSIFQEKLAFKTNGSTERDTICENAHTFTLFLLWGVVRSRDAFARSPHVHWHVCAYCRSVPERPREPRRPSRLGSTRPESAAKTTMRARNALRARSHCDHCRHASTAKGSISRASCVSVCVCLFVCSKAPKRTRFPAHANNHHHRPSGHQVNWTYSGGGVIKVSGRTQQMRACRSSCVAISLRCAVDARAFTFVYCVRARVPAITGTVQ